MEKLFLAVDSNRSGRGMRAPATKKLTSAMKTLSTAFTLK
jgi:hypothetical protein